MATNQDDTTQPQKSAAGGVGFENAQRSQEPIPHGGSSGSGSAPPSNTAPANCTGSLSGTTILRTSIDSLYLSCRGRLSEKIESRLQTLKQRAQSEDLAERASAFLSIGEHHFQVKDKGKGRYAYVLIDNWFHLQVSSRTATRLPMVYAQLQSAALTGEGPKSVLHRLAQIIIYLHEEAEVMPPLNVSRVDLCADFCTDIDLSSLAGIQWVTRATKMNRFTEGGNFTGLVFGAGGDVSMRLYDKTREIAKSQKTYLYDHWALAGWDLESAVWRVEFQFRRTALKELNVCTVGELMTHLGGLWEYGTEQWMQLKIRTQDRTSTRWPLHPLWQYLQEADWGEIEKSLWRVSTSRLPSNRALFLNGLGVLSSYMAKEGINNVETAVRRYIEDAAKFHKNRNGGDEEAFERYLIEKTIEKSTRYNRPARGLLRREDDEA